MPLRPVFILLAALALAPLALASDKTIPTYVLHARTVAIVVDPDAGVDLQHPNANQDAQRDVEAAILAWGRFTPVLGAQQADLIIVLRRSTGKLAQQTLPDSRQNSRPGSINATPDSIVIGAQHGPQPSAAGNHAPDGTQPGAPDTHPQAEIGSPNDSFTVYHGTGETGIDTVAVMDAPPVWRSSHKDALHPHDVPAVAEFRKAIAEAEKQAAKQAGKHP